MLEVCLWFGLLLLLTNGTYSGVRKCGGSVTAAHISATGVGLTLTIGTVALMHQISEGVF